MNAFVAEFIGTAFLVMFGNGVVANVVLAKTKGANSGWIVITAPNTTSAPSSDSMKMSIIDQRPMKRTT